MRTSSLWTGDAEYVYANQSTGTWNLFEGRLGTAPPKQLTSFEDDGVLFPSASRDGSTIVFLRRFDLHRLDLDSGRVTKLDLWYAGDPTVETKKRVRHNRATAAAFTDDAREIAFVAGGDLWVMDTVLKEPVRVTYTDGFDGLPVPLPDGRSMAWTSSRQTEKGQLYLADWDHEKALEALAASPLRNPTPTEE